MDGTAAVIDLGSGVVKAGWAGDDRPRLAFPSLVGAPKHARVMAGGALDAALVGGEAVGAVAAAHRGALRLRSPLRAGRIEDAAGATALLRAAYASGGGGLGAPPDGQALLLTEAPLAGASPSALRLRARSHTFLRGWAVCMCPPSPFSPNLFLLPPRRSHSRRDRRARLRDAARPGAAAVALAATRAVRSRAHDGAGGRLWRRRHGSDAYLRGCVARAATKNLL